MDNSLIEILTPKETVSDDSYKISSIIYKNGEAVKKGQLIGSFETSKADIDVEAPEEGFVFYPDIKTGGTIKVGEVFAVISNVNEYPEQYFIDAAQKQQLAQQENKTSVADTKGIRISKSAMELIEKNNIDIAVFAGKKLVTREDVEAALVKKSPGDAKADFSSGRPKLLIVGAGGHAKICIDIIRQNNLYDIVGLTSNNAEKKDVMGVPVLGTDDEVLEKYFAQGVRFAVIGIGSLKRLTKRTEIFNQLKKIGFHIPTIIHPRAICEPSASIAEGCQVMAGAIIGSDVRINPNCIINSGSVISHDCYLEENIHLTPGSILAGNVYVGKDSIIGMGAAVYLGVIIGSGVIVSNHSNVLKDIPDNTIVAGNPAQAV